VSIRARIRVRVLAAQAVFARTKNARDALPALEAALAEPGALQDDKARRLCVDAAMLAAGAAAGAGLRDEAVRLWARARQLAPAYDVGLRRLIDAAETGHATDWAVAAMVSEVGRGKAFRCRNGHLYFIGECGGAMEESVCPDCGAGVGGGRHALRGDNTHAGDVDGTTGGGAWAQAAVGFEGWMAANPDALHM
jgi:hypothetical protein